jgi:hypothetical protein
MWKANRTGGGSMRALLKFDKTDAREVYAESKADDEATKIHDALFEQFQRLAGMRADNENLRNEIMIARSLAELSEQIIKRDMSTIIMNRLANDAAADVKLPKFFLR